MARVALSLQHGGKNSGDLGRGPEGLGRESTKKMITNHHQPPPTTLGLGWFLVGQKSPQSLVILVLFYCFCFAFDFFAALQRGESDSTRFSRRC